MYDYKNKDYDDLQALLLEEYLEEANWAFSISFED